MIVGHRVARPPHCGACWFSGAGCVCAPGPGPCPAAPCSHSPGVLEQLALVIPHKPPPVRWDNSITQRAPNHPLVLAPGTKHVAPPAQRPQILQVVRAAPAQRADVVDVGSLERERPRGLLAAVRALAAAPVALPDRGPNHLDPDLPWCSSVSHWCRLSQRTHVRPPRSLPSTSQQRSATPYPDATPRGQPHRARDRR